MQDAREKNSPQENGGELLPMKLDVTVRPITPKNNLIAFASVKINDCFAVEGIKIITGDKGLYIGMPSVTDGRGGFNDVCHPTTSAFRAKLTEAVLAGYDAAIEKMWDMLDVAETHRKSTTPVKPPSAQTAEDVARRLRSAAALHDIGKNHIPASILNKPGKLTDDEFEIIKTHTTEGAKILASVQGELGVMARTLCSYHHEHYSGNGGYWHKYTCDLPAYVAIVALADVFVALVCKRAYKHAWPPEEALDYIKQNAGTQFNPTLVNLFIPLIRRDERVSALFIANDIK